MPPRPPALIVALSVAAAGVLIGCGPASESTVAEPVRPAAAPAQPLAEPAPGLPAARQLLVGEMCPTAAAGRPAVRPLFLRRQVWTDRLPDVNAPVERHGARQFSVLAWEGRRAGVFSVAGAADLDGRIVAIGAYAGRSPCEKPRGAGGASAERDADCVAAQRGCGLAVSVLEPAGGFKARPVGEDPDPVELTVGGACVADGKLLVDIDGDGAPEAYPVAGFDQAGAPADEVGSVPVASASCPARFAIRSALVRGVPPAGSEMDVLGVVDLDEDGRREIVASFRKGTRRTWALYQATETVARLDRAAVADAWPGP